MIVAFYGSNDTKGGEAVVTALYDRFSLSGGAVDFQTDGFRENNQLEHTIYNVFGQAAISPVLNIQAEYRTRDSHNGDLKMNFDPNMFSPEFRSDIDQDIWRLS